LSDGTPPMRSCREPSSSSDSSAKTHATGIHARASQRSRVADRPGGTSRVASAAKQSIAVIAMARISIEEYHVASTFS
jgi:hypothetical protein